jgi:hypothetical protein
MKRVSLLSAALALFAQSSPAIAGSSTLPVTPGSGATLRVGTDGSANLFGNGAICDGAACALLASVNGAGTPGTNGLAIQGLTGGVPVPISATSLPLPTGASTAAGLTTINTTLGSPFQAGGSIGNTTFAATQSGSWSLVNISGTVSLPIGAATAANQEVTAAGTSATSAQGVQGVTGGVALPVSATALPLPTGAATSANQTNASQKTQIVDGSGNVIASTSNNLNVQCANCSGSGVSTADGATWTAGTSLFAGVGGTYQTTTTSNPLTTGHQGFAQLTQFRALMTDWFNSSGAEMGTSTTPVQVSLANTGANTTAIAVNPGTAANWGILIDNAAWTAGTTPEAAIGCEYTLGGATALTTGHVGTPGCTIARGLFTDIESVAGTALGAPSNYGTSPGAVAVLGVNAFITNTPTVTANAGTNLNTSLLALETGGNLATTATNTGTIAGAVTSSVMQENLKQVNGVTTLTGAGATGTGSQRHTVAQDTTTIAGSAPGTAGSASANVMTVQGIASMTPFLVNPGTAANWGVVGQASTTSGQSGQLGLGAVTTSAPTYTTAQSDPLSLDTSGNLRVNCTTGCSASSSITGWAGGTIGTGTIQAFGATQGTIGAGLVPAFNAYVVNTLANLAWSADGVANTTNGSPTTSLMMASNGTTVDRLEDDANKNLKVAQQATPTGGDSTSGAIVPNNTTAVVLKASAGTLYGVQLAGIGSAPAYLKFYNATSATCGSGTPVKRLMIPAASTAANGAGSNVSFGPQGIAFGTGITYCVTTGITDADTTAPAASTFLVNVDWD